MIPLDDGGSSIGDGVLHSKGGAEQRIEKGRNHRVENLFTEEI